MIDGLVQIITGRRSVKDLGGPIKIAQIAGQQASVGFLRIRPAARIASQLISGSSTFCQSRCWMEAILFFMPRRRFGAARSAPGRSNGRSAAGLALILALVLFTTVNDLGSIGLWDGFNA